MRRGGTRWLGAAAVGLLAAAVGWADDPPPAAKGKAPPAAKADAGDDALKAELLKFNRMTDEKALGKVLVALVKDKPKAKRAAALAYKLQKDAKGGDKPFNYSGAHALGRVALAVKEYEAAEHLFEFAADAATKIESGEKMVNAYDGLVDTYWAQRRYDDVVDVVEKFVELPNPPEPVRQAQPFLLERLIQAKALQGKHDEALKAAEGLMQLDEGGWYFVRLKGWVLREAGKYDAAIAAYQDVLDRLDAAKRLKADVRDRYKDEVEYLLSGIHVDNKDVPAAAKQLQGLIKKHPDNPTYKNDLGFIWADADLKLDEAEALIREALELDKKRQEKAKADGDLDEVTETAAYVDSLGWVLFKKKKYEEALAQLKKAAADEEEGNHLEIWDHLGDCLQAMGKKDEAVAAWKKGLTMDDLGRRDVERRKKVTAKLRAAGAEAKEKEKKPAKKGGD